LSLVVELEPAQRRYHITEVEVVRAVIEPLPMFQYYPELIIQLLLVRVERSRCPAVLLHYPDPIYQHHHTLLLEAATEKGSHRQEDRGRGVLVVVYQDINPLLKKQAIHLQHHHHKVILAVLVVVMVPAPVVVPVAPAAPDLVMVRVVMEVLDLRGHIVVQLMQVVEVVVMVKVILVLLVLVVLVVGVVVVVVAAVVEVKMPSLVQ